jgi:hypothetical protein
MENSLCKINNKRSCSIIGTIIFLLLIASLSGSGSGAAFGSSDAYDSGYDQGCDDAGLSPSDRYINEPGKGPEFHTGTFMDGYNAGFNACSGGGSDGSPRNGNVDASVPPDPGYDSGYEQGCKDKSISDYNIPPIYFPDARQGYEDGFMSCSNFDAETPQHKPSQEGFQLDRGMDWTNT